MPSIYCFFLQVHFLPWNMIKTKRKAETSSLKFVTKTSKNISCHVELKAGANLTTDFGPQNFCFTLLLIAHLTYVLQKYTVSEKYVSKIITSLKT
jgi:urate oxidase